jgi:hypothetical protein
MTANRLVRESPQTRRLFDELFISLPIEGCDCLDEIAWRHGMEGHELVAKLEEVIQPQPVAEQQSAACEGACGSCAAQPEGALYANAGAT